MQYLDPHLAAMYDELNRDRRDIDFWLRLAGARRRRVLDIGAGTGLLARILAERGHDVTGVDPAPAMVAQARSGDTGSRVRWVVADGRALDLGVRFDLAYMTGHVFQLFADDAEADAVLRVAHDHLDVGGRLALDSRNPAAAAWRGWSPEASRRSVAIGGDVVTAWHEVVAIAGDVVDFTTTFEIGHGGDVRVSRSRLRFRSLDDILGRLANTGFGRVDVHGDWDGSPAAPSAPELILVARRDPL